MRRRTTRSISVAVGTTLLFAVLTWDATPTSAHHGGCGGGYHNHGTKCHKHCRNAQSGRHNGLSLHGENCSVNNRPRPTRRPPRRPTPRLTATRRPPPATPTRRPPPTIPTPRPTPGATPPASSPVGANFGRGDCGCTSGSLDPLRNTGIDWLDTAAFDTYAATVCAQTSGPYFEAKDFIGSWRVDPPHPTLRSQAVLSQSPGTSRYAIAATATGPRKARCTAANVSAGEVPTVTTPALDCTGAQAHLSAAARTWIAGDLQQTYPGAAVRGAGQHCTGTTGSLRTHFEQTADQLINPGNYETVVRVCYDGACHQTDMDDDILAVALMSAAAVNQ